MRTRTGHKRQRAQLSVEVLEDRSLPSGVSISVANASLNEIGNVSPFVTSGSGGLNQPKDLVLGPDGNVYVASAVTNSVIRYSSTGQLLGTFVTAGSGGIANPKALAFGPDGNLYVSSVTNNNILEYNGSTGAFLGAFVSAGSGGLNNPCGVAFGTDGNLYVSSCGTESVDRFQGPLGAAPGTPLPAAGQSGATFVASGSGGLAGPNELAFGPNGNLFVSNGLPVSSVTNNNYGVLEFDPTTGAFITTFVGSNHITVPRGFAFDQDGRLYVADQATNAIHRFDSQGNYLDDPVTSSASSLQSPIGMVFDAQGDLLVSSRDGNAVYEYNSGVTVTLSGASATPVSVGYTTIDGTAKAPGDYTAQAGTVTFAPGQTSRLILLATVDNCVVEGNTTFTVQLSNPSSGTTIAVSSAVVIILDGDATKFFVSDTGANNTYRYNVLGQALGNNSLGSGDTQPRGIAANASGTTEWVVDANKNVYVYSPGGALLGSWSAGGLPSGAQLTGIATNGTDIWLLDPGSTAVVYKYPGAASRLSGSQTASSSFTLAGGKNGDTNPQDMVTDGTSLWVVDGSSLKVFKYTLASGKLLGSWAIDPANTHPTGITINPNNVSDIWIVDNGTDKVYQYIGAASRTSGSQNAGATFALAPGNTNPQGIADPPPADSMLPARATLSGTQAGSNALPATVRTATGPALGPVSSSPLTVGSIGSAPFAIGNPSLSNALQAVANEGRQNLASQLFQAIPQETFGLGDTSLIRVHSAVDDLDHLNWEDLGSDLSWQMTEERWGTTERHELADGFSSPSALDQYFSQLAEGDVDLQDD